MRPLDPIFEADEVIRDASPALWEVLSPLGRSARQPASFLPLQTVEARGKTFNATIGQITDGRGQAVPLPSMAAAFRVEEGGLEAAERSQAFLYSPVDGLAELRRVWRERQRQGVAAGVPSSLPIVTLGTAQARALAADLFVTPGRAVVLPEPFRLSDHELFAVRHGARVLPVRSVPDALAELPAGEPALVLFDLSGGEPLRPLAAADRDALLAALAGAARRRPLVVVVDDTWEDPERFPGGSLFWPLVGLHANLVAIKVDGADGVLGFSGGRVGFLTLPWEPESAPARALESKIKMLLRAMVGSPSAATQTLLLRALRRR